MAMTMRFRLAATLQPLTITERLNSVSKSVASLPVIRPAVVRNPVQQRYLIGSKWSRMDGQAKFVHYECIARDAEQVIFRSVLRPHDTITFAWRELRDVAAWHPGWVNCRDVSAAVADAEATTDERLTATVELGFDVTDAG